MKVPSSVSGLATHLVQSASKMTSAVSTLGSEFAPIGLGGGARLEESTRPTSAASQELAKRGSAQTPWETVRARILEHATFKEPTLNNVAELLKKVTSGTDPHHSTLHEHPDDIPDGLIPVEVDLLHALEALKKYGAIVVVTQSSSNKKVLIICGNDGVEEGLGHYLPVVDISSRVNHPEHTASELEAMDPLTIDESDLRSHMQINGYPFVDAFFAGSIKKIFAPSTSLLAPVASQGAPKHWCNELI